MRVPMLKNGGIWGLGLLLLLAALIGGLSIGRYPVALSHVWQILLDAVFIGDNSAPDWSPTDGKVVLYVRMPRVLIAALVGAGLAVSGAALQGIFKNPLVGPQILGVSSGAAFGGVLAIFFFSSMILTVSLAFLGGVAAIFLVFVLGFRRGGESLLMLILAGVVINAFFAALISLMTYFADPNNTLQAIVFWLMGSFASATYDKLWLVLPVITLCSLLIFMLRFRINVLSLGEGDARALGMPVSMTRWTVLLCVTLMTSATVAISGTIGWVGLIIPHMARFIVGHDHRRLIPASALLGASYMVAVDTLARSVTSAEIPLGVITALIGAPIFAALLRSVNKRRNA
ncbi:iron ABC transporter permease [Cedecea neteri]|uniref:FecCD family ABC transporter permease n=1 Tax=Cedecea neteri TaxID=158822 RepID=UPI002AA71270|nr:iron ABC transporter permease [Cedecea neteri]WPU21392.1 iron ABC transporter permease [Cedecea neteri]